MKFSLLSLLVCLCILSSAENIYAIPGDVKVDCNIRTGNFARSMTNRVKESLKTMGSKSTRVRVQFRKVGPSTVPATSVKVSSEVSYQIDPTRLGLLFSGIPTQQIYLAPCTIPVDMTVFTDAEFPTSTPGVTRRVKGTSYYKNIPFPGVMD